MNKFIVSAAKRICLALLACVLLTFSATAQTPAKWVFVCIHKQENITPCVNPVNTDTRMVPLKLDATYDAQRKLLLEEAKRRFIHYYLQEFFVREGTEHYIAKVLKQRRCPDGKTTKCVSTYWFYDGKSRADIEAKMAQNGRDYPENVRQEIVELIDCRTKIPR